MRLEEAYKSFVVVEATHGKIVRLLSSFLLSSFYSGGHVLLSEREISSC